MDADGIVITKRGRAVARLIAIEAESAELIGVLAGKLLIEGDILSTGSPGMLNLDTRVLLYASRAG